MNRRQLLTMLGGLGLAHAAGAAPARGASPTAPRCVRVYKSARRLELWAGDTRRASFPIALGGAPEGDKERQGDLRTPEGVFYVAWKNPRSAFHLFLGLSYPMPRHARAALAAGRVPRATYEAVRAAAGKKAIPPQTSALGGYVGIHGGGVGSDWTLGCVALEDADIKTLYAQVRRGDRVEVYP
jgi:murein L,D-transpeptidase YafK